MELAAAETQLLAAELELLRARDAGPVDLVLPPGIYEQAEERPGALAIPSGVRLLGEGRPLLRVALSFGPGSDVVLEGLHLAPPQGNVLVLERATVLVRDCLVEATSLAAQLADSVLELDRCEFVPRVESGQISGGIRAARLSMVVARESRLVSGSGVLFGARITFLERCVVDGGERNAIESRLDGELVLVDTLVRSRADALSNVASGVLEGPILVAGGQAVRTL